MPGQMRWPLLEPYAVTTERAQAKGGLWDTGAGYPAAQFDEKGGDIPGFLVTIGPAHVREVVAILDAIEGEGTLFRRTEIRTSGGPAMSYEWIGSTEGMSGLTGGWPGRPF